MSDLREVFSLFQSHDDDGTVTVTDMCAIVERLGREMPPMEKMELVAKIDDGDGTVEFEEFAVVFTGQQTHAQQVRHSQQCSQQCSQQHTIQCIQCSLSRVLPDDACAV